MNTGAVQRLGTATTQTVTRTWSSATKIRNLGRGIPKADMEITTSPVATYRSGSAHTRTGNSTCRVCPAIASSPRTWTRIASAPPPPRGMAIPRKVISG